MMQKWEHCKLVGRRVHFMGAAGLLEDKADSHLGQRKAWSKLEDEGWQLVTAIADPEGEIAFYFKRPVPPKT